MRMTRSLSLKELTHTRLSYLLLCRRDSQLAVVDRINDCSSATTVIRVRTNQRPHAGTGQAMGVVVSDPAAHSVRRASRAPTDDELKGLLDKLIVRVMKMLTRRGDLVEEQGMTYGATESSSARNFREISPHLLCE